MSPTKPVVIVGAGLAGLNCACYLAREKINHLLLERDNRVGGRVQTDCLDGFRLDRGFHVFQTAYPEAQRTLDYAALDLQPLEPGALIFKQGKWVRMSDPWRRPRYALATLFNSIGTLADRFKLLKLQRECRQGELDDMLVRAGDETTLRLFQDRYQFSPKFTSSFLRPWFSGVFLEPQLSTSANYLRFVFRMLAAGDISYPAAGIQAIPNQLAARLDVHKLRLGSPVKAIDANFVQLASGETLQCAAVVLATDLDATLKLLGETTVAADYSATRCVYFQSETPPLKECTLMLDGDGGGPANHVMVLSNASAQVAPTGQALISVSLVGKHALDDYDPRALRAQMRAWFGNQVDTWNELANYLIPQALPRQPVGFATHRTDLVLPAGVFMCGDHRESTSVHGALKSGRQTAETVIGYLNQT